eukprot:5917083-Prymnesium_polylepis.1
MVGCLLLAHRESTAIREASACLRLGGPELVVDKLLNVYNLFDIFDIFGALGPSAPPPSPPCDEAELVRAPFYWRCGGERGGSSWWEERFRREAPSKGKTQASQASQKQRLKRKALGVGHSGARGDTHGCAGPPLTVLPPVS